MQTRTRLVADDRLGLYSRSELCAPYSISRKTGYKWLTRYHHEGPPASTTVAMDPTTARSGPPTERPPGSATSPLYDPSPENSPSRMPQALPHQSRHRGRDHSTQGQTPLPRQPPQTPTRRSRGNRRWHLGHSLRQRPPRQGRCTRHDPTRMTPKYHPQSITHPPGCSPTPTNNSSDLLAFEICGPQFCVNNYPLARERRPTKH